jgi:hypothetical protein
MTEQPPKKVRKYLFHLVQHSCGQTRSGSRHYALRVTYQRQRDKLEIEYAVVCAVYPDMHSFTLPGNLMIVGGTR